MSMQKRLLTRGMLLLASFSIVLVVIFSPVFPGKNNGLVYMDNLFNMISKGSCYFIPDAMGDNQPFKGKTVRLTLQLPSEAQAFEVKYMLQARGAAVTKEGSRLTLTTDLGALVEQVLADANLLYHNNSRELERVYGLSGQQAIYNWWRTLKAMTGDLTAQRDFKSAKLLDDIIRRVLEPAYNYYGVAPMRWQDNMLLILGSLAFYVIYTVWYGFGLLHLFEGLGLKTGH